MPETFLVSSVAELNRAAKSEAILQIANIFSETGAIGWGAAQLTSILTTQDHGQLAGYECLALSQTKSRKLVILAAILTRVIGEVTEVLHIGVSFSYRRHGYAERLFREVIERTKRASGSKIELEVRKSNKAAIGLYQKIGFDQVGMRRSYYPPDTIYNGFAFVRQADPKGSTSCEDALLMNYTIIPLSPFA